MKAFGSDRLGGLVCLDSLGSLGGLNKIAGAGKQVSLDDPRNGCNINFELTDKTDQTDKTVQTLLFFIRRFQNENRRINIDVSDISFDSQVHSVSGIIGNIQHEWYPIPLNYLKRCKFNAVA